MKIFSVFIWAFVLHVAAAEAQDSLKDIFPKYSELPGGNSSWIVSGVKEEKRERCTVYENTYTYYSGKGSVLFGIERSNTYMVSVRIFACDNFLSAVEEYEGLLAAEDKIESPKKSAAAAFGERGVLTAIPVKKDSMMADFYLTYLLRTFVVQVYSDDGFAQMDMAGEIERRLNLYSSKQGASYFINKINLKITHGKLKESGAVVSFTGDNITSAVIDGAVFDGNNRPVPGAEITAKETGQKTVTDENGDYSLEVSAGQGKSVSLKKIIFMDGVMEGGEYAVSSGLYPLDIFKSGDKREEYVLKILSTGGRIIGTAYRPDGSGGYPVNGALEGDGLSFILNCTPEGASFKCSRSFTGSVSGGLVKGEWKGTGGNGAWEINKSKFVVVKEKPYLRDAGIGVSSVKFAGSPVSGSVKPLLAADNKKPRSFIGLTVGRSFAEDIYFKEGRLILNVAENVSEADSDMFLYAIEKDGENVKLKKITLLSSVGKGKTGLVAVDISSQMRLPDKAGYLIGIESEKEASVVFSDDVSLELAYYRDVENYKPLETVSGRIVSFEGSDFTGNSNAVRPDGADDIMLEAAFAAPGRVLEYIEITAESGSLRRWNTNPFDIYPAVAVKSAEGIINNADGSISKRLSEGAETFELYIYKGTLEPENIKSIKLRAVIDGKVYENVIEK